MSHICGACHIFAKQMYDPKMCDKSKCEGFPNVMI